MTAEFIVDMASADEMKKHIINLEKKVNDLQNKLISTNNKAAEAVESWGADASEYLQEKWDLQSDIEQFRGTKDVEITK